MTKKLQRRFIKTAMIAISVLLIILLGTINILNSYFSEHESDKILNMLAMSDSKPPRPAPPKEFRRDAFSPTPPEDSKMSALYFTAKETDDGDFTIDLNRISSITEGDAQTLLANAINADADTGKAQNFKYKRSVSPISGHITYVFLDTSTHRYSVIRVATVSLFAGAAVWLMMLLLVTLLSRHAIRPIAENIEKQKQFVTDAGHEIKTPLAIILANTEAMELKSGENKWSKNIKAQVSRLDGLMKDLLTLAKSDEANTDFPKEEINLSALVFECIEMFVEPAALRSIFIDDSIAPEVTLTSNKDYLMRVVSTLLDNAVKYAKQESEISVALTKSEKGIRFSVKNECDCLPDCPPEKLFDRFYRGDEARTQKSGGYGIGLSAARAISSLLGGKLTAKYEEANTINFIFKL